VAGHEFKKEKSWRARVASFACAFRGLWRLVATQWNARFHAVATVLVVAAGFKAHLCREEWALVALAIGLVWAAEGVNTAIEFALDRVSPEAHPLVRDAKDIAAGAVLAAAITAVVIGAIVFWRRF
jgi:diacylglycerol kinase (ATP)